MQIANKVVNLLADHGHTPVPEHTSEYIHILVRELRDDLPHHRHVAPLLKEVPTESDHEFCEFLFVEFVVALFLGCCARVRECHLFFEVVD